MMEPVKAITITESAATDTAFAPKVVVAEAVICLAFCMGLSRSHRAPSHAWRNCVSAAILSSVDTVTIS